jgi:transposase
LKVHAAIDAETKTVLAWQLTEPTVHDGTQLGNLLDRIHAPIREVYADAGYLSRKSCLDIQAKGATPFIRPTKQTRQAREPNARGVHKTPFDAMIWRYQQDPAAWLKKYHLRSRIEGTFGSIKRRLGGRLAALARHTLRIEACLKLLAWNLTRVKAGEF